jgi:dynein heavy chain
MRESLKKYLYSTFSTYCKKKDPKAIGDWVENHHGQLLITASQIYWTSDCENILKNIMNSEKPDKGKAWKSLKEEKSFFLNELTKQVRKTTKFVTRLKLIALITI